MRAYHTTWTPELGACLLIPSGPRHDPNRMHLHVVITAVTPDGKALVVPITKLTNTKADDLACVLGNGNDGDHEFLHKPSYAFYEEASIWRVEQLTNCVRNRTFVAKQPASSKMLSRLQQGGRISKRIRPIHQRML